MSFHNHAETKKIERDQNCQLLKSTQSFGLKLHNSRSGRVSIEPSKSSGSSPPLLLVTGTQIAQKHVDTCSPSNGLPRSHLRRHSSRFVGSNVDNNRIHLPRLDDSSKDVNCALQGNGESEDVAFRDETSTSVKYGCVRVQDVAPSDHAQLDSLFIVKNVPPKIMPLTKSKPILTKRLSLLPILSQNKDISRNAEMRRKMTRSNSLPASCPSSEIDNTFLPLKQDDKLQDIGTSKINNVEHQLEPHCSKGPDEHSLKQRSGIVPATFQSRQLSEEVSKTTEQHLDSVHLMEAFNSVWPELLKDLVKEYVADFENMDIHMKQCMTKLLNDNTETRLQ